MSLRLLVPASVVAFAMVDDAYSVPATPDKPDSSGLVTAVTYLPRFGSRRSDSRRCWRVI